MEGEGFSWIQEWWPQVLGIGLLIVIATRLKEQVHELRKDVSDIMSRNTFVETVKLRAELNVLNKQVSALWIMINKINEREK